MPFKKLVCANLSLRNSPGLSPTVDLEFFLGWDTSLPRCCRNLRLCLRYESWLIRWRPLAWMLWALRIVDLWIEVKNCLGKKPRRW